MRTGPPMRSKENGASSERLDGARGELCNTPAGRSAKCGETSVTEPPRTTGPGRRVADGIVDEQSLVVASADVTAVKTVEGVFRYVSPACHLLFGWDPADLEGRR